jgi:hypothetical protein
MTMAEIAVMREALHEKIRAESGKAIGNSREAVDYLAWVASLDPLTKVHMAARGEL